MSKPPAERRRESASIFQGRPSSLWRRLSRGLVAGGWFLAAAALGLIYPLSAGGIDLFEADWRWPWALLGLLLAPPLLWRGTLGEDRRIPRLRLGTLAPLQRGPRGFRVLLRDLPGAVRAAAFAILLLALARPVDTLNPQITDEQGIDLVVALDLSGSMGAIVENVPKELERYLPGRQTRHLPTRLDAAKAVIRDFIARRKSDRIGVVVFGQDAYVLSPPTLDYSLLDSLVSKMELKLIDGSATAIGEAVGIAAARLRNSDAESKAVILLTDGDNNAGKVAPEYAAHLAQTLGVKVFTILLGEGDMALVQQGTDLFGQPRMVQMPAPTNPKLLNEIAKDTGGEAYVASDARSLQASFHSVLDKLEKTRFESSIARYSELFALFLLPGVLLLALDALLRTLVLRRFP